MKPIPILTTWLFLVVHAECADILFQLRDPPATGTVAFALFDSPNTFGDLRDPALVAAYPLDGREMYSITNVMPGEYALLVYYDENGNGRIDKNFIGIPKEPLGFSNGYMPKGPPSFSRAAFVLADNDVREFEAELYRPLGKRGRLGVGLGIISRSSPYRAYDGAVYQFIPAITYTGDRLQWFGPRVQLGLIGTGKLRLAATGEYRMAPYEESGSKYLAGMGDPESTLMAGLSLQSELPGGVDLSLGGAMDALDRIGGTQASIGIDKSFQFGIVRLSPGLAVNWIDDAMAMNDFGVRDAYATPTRPAYEPGSTIGLEGGLSLFLEITPDWLVAGSAGIEWLDANATGSPIVDDNHVVKMFGTINYVF